MAEAQLKDRRSATALADISSPGPALNTHEAVVREVAGCHFANHPETGALSVFNTAELMAFQRLGSVGGVREAEEFFRQLGQSQQEAEANTQRLVRRLTRDGWARTGLPESTSRPLSSVYFTLTRECDLACPYCYQGLRKRARKTMPLDQVRAIMDKIAAINPDSHIMVTGGEPVLHPDFFEILELIRDRGFTASVMTNGGLIDDEAAARLAGFDNIERVQVSIDGNCEETHAITRGPRSFDKSMAGIRALARHKVPLLLAPTIHDGNADEILDLARLAIELGGSISANDLKQLPQDENAKVTLAPDTLRRVKAELGDFLTEMFRKDDRLRDRITQLSSRACASDPVNATFICGVAHSLVDIDWNGDVYPCHLLKGDELVLGNVLRQPFEEIFAKGREDGFRTESHEMEKCSACSYMSVCGSGCRAATYFSYGTPSKASPFCSEHRWGITRTLLQSKGASVPEA